MNYRVCNVGIGEATDGQSSTGPETRDCPDEISGPAKYVMQGLTMRDSACRNGEK